MAQSIKLSDDLMAEVWREAKLQGRSLAAQLEHWVRIGRAIEMYGNFNYSKVTAVLAAQAQTSTLNDAEHAVWGDRFDDLISKPGPNGVGSVLA